MNKQLRFSEADKQFLRNNIETMTNDELAQHLGRTISSIQTVLSKVMGLKRSSSALSQRLVSNWKKRAGTWSEAERRFLTDNWQTLSRAEMAAALNRTPSAVKSMGQKEMGLVKTTESIKALRKRIGSNSGTFKNGHLPYNTIHGDEQVIRVRKNKDKQSYQWVRTGFKQWRQLHVWVWEQANGSVPDGYILNFHNNNQMDCRLENLFLTTRADHAARHSGSHHLTSKYVAHTISRDPDLKSELLKQPELIELQRQKLQLNRLIKHA